ncbi:MobQ family relaxase [Rhodanobacter sp. MP1X3]|uniref:MobQ family relaxase n=1 Tax=Rhodanobacter sp. MP1X3 TaxID=2723086 RepID=UPI00184A56AC|nr:hypothetical protein [Rhodanobacter sp. MP1X3]
MAIYRFSAQVIGRSSGRSATAAAAYRAGVELTDQRTGVAHDYTRRSGVKDAFILTPAGAPVWAADRSALWNAVELGEKRKDAQVCREVLLALPHELDTDRRRALVEGFCRDQFTERGMVADVALHAPNRKGDDRNHHAHILLTMRGFNADAFGPKMREWNDTVMLEGWREAWEVHTNQALERAGQSARVDHRSLAAQQADAFEHGDLAAALAFGRLAQTKVGVNATQMDRRAGRVISERGRVRERAMVLARHALSSAARWAQELMDAMRPQAETLVRAEIGEVQATAPALDAVNDMPASAAQRPADGVDLAAVRRRQEDAEKRKKKEEKSRLVDFIQKWRMKADEGRSKPDELVHEKEKTKMPRPKVGVGADASGQAQQQQRQERDRDGGPEARG